MVCGGFIGGWTRRTGNEICGVRCPLLSPVRDCRVYHVGRAAPTEEIPEGRGMSPDPTLMFGMFVAFSVGAVVVLFVGLWLWEKMHND